MTTEHTEATEVATPETDKNCGWALTNHYGRSEGRYLHMDRSGPFVPADFARQLERERDEARDVVKILCDEKPERPIYFQSDIDEWMERHALSVQECEKLQRERDEARERSAKLAAQLLAEMEARP